MAKGIIVCPRAKVTVIVCPCAKGIVCPWAKGIGCPWAKGIVCPWAKPTPTNIRLGVCRLTNFFSRPPSPAGFGPWTAVSKASCLYLALRSWRPLKKIAKDGKTWSVLDEVDVPVGE